MLMVSSRRAQRSFAETLRDLRLAAGLTQTEVARRAGVTAGYISQLETDLRGGQIARDRVLTLAQAIGVQPDELLIAADMPVIEPVPGPTFGQVVRRDPQLTKEQKRMLVELYRSWGLDPD